jgi:pimeloyl-ACP methyl ester carboxylesterase
VQNLHEPFTTRTIHGTWFDPACAADTIVLLMHGLSYTRAAWNVDGYSVVEPLLEAGVAVVTIDRLGYGESTLPDGYNISSEGHAFIAAQIVRQLHEQAPTVILGGHSAGAEATMLSAGLFGGPDAIAVLGYHHEPSPEIVTEFVTGDNVRAAQDDYEYFLETPEHRADMFFTDAADDAVVAADASAAVLTPSGEVFSIGKQPSRYVVAKIDVPVFLQLGDSDRLFPVEYADEEALLFASAPSVTTDIVASAGHTFMLHPSGPAGSQRLADWASSVAPTC